MSKDGRLFSISVNMAVLLQALAAMELANSDRGRKALLPPVAVRVAICALVLEKWINRPPSTLSALFGAIWRKQPPNPADRECRAAKMGETGDGWQGRNVCRLKGGWLLQASSPGKRRTARPSGKERCHPEIRGTAKWGGIRKESAGNKAFVWVAWM